MLEYRTTVQPLWRDATSAHFGQPDGIYHAPTAPLEPPPEPGGGSWQLHSVQPLALFGEPKLLVVWMRDASAWIRELREIREAKP